MVAVTAPRLPPRPLSPPCALCLGGYAARLSARRLSARRSASCFELPDPRFAGQRICSGGRGVRGGSGRGSRHRCGFADGWSPDRGAVSASAPRFRLIGESGRDDDERMSMNQLPSRRDVLRGMVVGAGAFAAPGLLAACTGQSGQSTGGGQPRRGGSLRVGVVGGGPEDTLDAHTSVAHPDIARVHQLYEPLMSRDRDFQLVPVVAESVEPNRDLTAWTVRLRDGITFHDGRPVRPEDVIATYRRITDRQDPKVGAELLSFLDTRNIRKLDPRTLRFDLDRPTALFLDAISEYFQGIVPEDYDPANPVGTGPFKYSSFEPGQQSVFTRYDDYWRGGEPWVDEVTIINFAEDSARVNALLSGQVEAINSLPYGQIPVVRSNPELEVLESESGNWNPFTMRVDAEPFSDPQVRQAIRLLCDRQQMIDQVLVGHGALGNDLYAPFDPCYPSDLPQREYDPEQARSLLRRAGHEGLQVELVTSPVSQGIVEAAQVLKQQARGVVDIRLRQVDTGTFYGENYLSWPFAQDFWVTRGFLAQVAQGSLPNSPFNETHWDDPEFISLVRAAEQEPDEQRRCDLIQQAQGIEHERGGHLIWGFINLVDGYSTRVSGLQASRAGQPLDSYGFRHVWFV
ncbi:MAG: peptide ABC transporter substrate-binding protein [Propionibacteriales bacterium]|nr:peptide ABC transporter substrate-binding protein [Propionibacteriales bacterium]